MIHNSLDLEVLGDLRERHLTRGTGQRPRRVAFLGRLVPVKRVDLFLEMARNCVDVAPCKLTFDVVGEGPLAAALREVADRLAMRGRLTFHGFRPDAVAWLADVDVLVFTSDHEGAPMAALEALAIGVPVVARAVGGLPEMLSGVAGCRLVEGDDPAVLAEAVLDALDAGEQPQVPERYGIRRCADLYRQLYKRVAQSQPSSSTQR